MADLTATIAQKLKYNTLPYGAVNFQADFRTTGDVSVSTIESVTGIFSIVDLLNGQGIGSYKVKTRSQDVQGNWGDYPGVWTTIDVVAPAPPSNPVIID